jgi:hypothetical protein
MYRAELATVRSEFLRAKTTSGMGAGGVRDAGSGWCIRVRAQPTDLDIEKGRAWRTAAEPRPTALQAVAHRMVYAPWRS